MAHACTHFNIQPGLYGKPMLRHDIAKQLLEALHKSELGLPKTPWKHGILNNSSDEARDLISAQLAEWKHPLDCRRKDDNRSRAQKWFTGEKWATFCAAERGSPGAPVAIATLVKIIADDLQARGSEGGADDMVAAVVGVTLATGGRGSGTGGRGSGRGGGRGRGAFAARAEAVQLAPSASAKKLEHVPSAIELAADPADLAIIRELYGSRAQTLINILLAFDGYIAWYYPYKASIPFLCDAGTRMARALSNCQTAIDLHEVFERVTIRNHKSFLPHGAIFKSTRDILLVGDVWAVGSQSLELQNAETKRTAETSGSRRLTTSASGMMRKPLHGKEGPAKLVPSKGYSSSMALSTLRTLLAAQKLRRGDGCHVMVASRRN